VARAYLSTIRTGVPERVLVPGLLHALEVLVGAVVEYVTLAEQAVELAHR